ncbi:MAG: dUTP diphosphatase [Proteobacteria bacterium]|nr:dUTP diphosphatase [Pseudomonadota bacterium]
MVKIKINILKNGISLPEYKTEHSSGMDICSSEDIVIKKGGISAVSTGIAVEIPPGYEIQVRPRSGLALKHGIGVLNSPGTVDADYRGEVKVILFNFSSGDYKIKKGDRIAQLVLSKVYKAEIVESKELSDTERGDGGFGHTGY